MYTKGKSNEDWKERGEKHEQTCKHWEAMTAYLSQITQRGQENL